MFKAIGSKIAGWFSRKPAPVAPLIVHSRQSVTGSGSVPLSLKEKAEVTHITANLIKRNERSWIQFHTELSTYPIFLINCHSALCKDYAMCVGRGGTYLKQPHHNKYGAKEIPSFTVSPNTYIWSIADAGENCLNTFYLDHAITDNIENYRKALTVTSLQDDIKQYPDERFTLISSSKRASDCEYPNLSATFEQDPRQIEINGGINSLGVYCLKDTDIVLDNKRTNVSNPNGYCILNDEHNGLYRNKVWFLSDIIEYVYSQPEFSGRKGIFILSGCAGPYRSYQTALKRNPFFSRFLSLEEHLGDMDAADTLITRNSLEYSNKKPVQSISEIRNIKGFADFIIKDAPLRKSPVEVDPNAAAGVINATARIHALANAAEPPAASSVPYAASRIDDDYEQ